MAKHFDLEIEDDAFGYRRKPESIAAEAALDGLYVVRTSLPAGELDAEGAVRAYKRLSAVERAFRSLKTVDLKVRPVFRRYTHPHAFRDLAKSDLPCSSMRESVPDDCFDERRGEVGGCIQHRIAPRPGREAGICRGCSQRRSDMPPRHDPVAYRKRRPDQQRLDQAPRIAAFGHVKVAPNPAAADRTSSSPPDRKRSMGRATPSSKGHS